MTSATLNASLLALMQAQRNIQLQLETHNQYINHLLASRSSELARTISAASSARVDGGPTPAPLPALSRPLSAHAVHAPQPQPQQHQPRPSGPAAMLQHPLRGSGTHAWNGHGVSQAVQTSEPGQQMCKFCYQQLCRRPI